MNSSDVVTIYVAFTQVKGGKRRPVYVIDKNDEVIHFYSITSQYENKSEDIKKQYVEIQDWVATGLRKRSWIDIGTLNKVPTDKVHWQRVGTLSDRDLRSLEQRLFERATDN